jgi:gliding motility-associated-like protein
MRVSLLLLILLLSVTAWAQKNAPVITGQRYLSTNENQPITIDLQDLQVTDRDNWFYPWGFTLQVFQGSNYTFQDRTVTPSNGFSGTLKVKVTVNDGKHDSKPYDVIIDVINVNTPPTITGQLPISITANTAITVKFADLIVSDPDNAYPTGFSIRLSPGANYAIAGTTVTPARNYTGMLSVVIRVNDGAADSQPYSLQIEVTDVLRITGQNPLTVAEDASITLELTDLVVNDPTNSYPAGFTLNITTGTNYQASNRTITPSPNFSGLLTVNVSVKKGVEMSNVYSLKIKVTPANDAPQLTSLESAALRHMVGNSPVAISEQLLVTDTDDTQMILAEVGIIPETYTEGGDMLTFVNTDLIRGVFDPAEGVLTLIGVASLEHYQEALRSVRYHYNEVMTLDREDRMLYIKLNDGKTVSETYQRAIIMGEEISLDIPTAFTPNDDLANDTWKIVALKNSERLSGAVISVCNSRGLLVYQATGFEQAWDGRYKGEKLPTDNYYYTIDMRLPSARNNFKGSVMLLR